MKYFSTFTGIGGFEIGIQQAYEKNRSKKNREYSSAKWDSKNTKSRTREWEYPICIGYSEVDKYAIQIYEKHFPKHKNYGDITKIIASEIPDHDLFVGGFPCQSFSIAGKRGGFKDTRGTLFFDIARILKVKRPKNFVLENVKGLLSHDKGNTFATIISTIDELGYDCQWSVLNSKNFGVPQNRERVFIVGHIRGEPRPKVFPIGDSNEKNIKTKFPNIPEIGEANRIYGTEGISPPTKPHHTLIEITKNKSQGNRVYDTKGISTTIASQAGGQGAKTGLYAIGGLQKNAAKMKDQSPALTEAMGKGGGHTPVIYAVASRGRHFVNGKRKDILGAETKQIIEKRNDSLMNCLSSVQKDGMLSDGTKIRRLTPVECERLQGFPDGWTEGVSDTQRYKTLGNAVTTNVIKEVITKLYEI